MLDSEQQMDEEELTIARRTRWTQIVQASKKLDPDEKHILMDIDDTLIKYVLRFSTAHKFLQMLSAIDSERHFNPDRGLEDLPEKYILILALLNEGNHDIANVPQVYKAAISIRQGVLATIKDYWDSE